MEFALREFFIFFFFFFFILLFLVSVLCLSLRVVARDPIFFFFNPFFFFFSNGLGFGPELLDERAELFVVRPVDAAPHNQQEQHVPHDSGEPAAPLQLIEELVVDPGDPQWDARVPAAGQGLDGAETPERAPRRDPLLRRLAPHIHNLAAHRGRPLVQPQELNHEIVPLRESERKR
jgi:hypothetical protein